MFLSYALHFAGHPARNAVLLKRKTPPILPQLDSQNCLIYCAF